MSEIILLYMRFNPSSRLVIELNPKSTSTLFTEPKLRENSASFRPFGKGKNLHLEVEPLIKIIDSATFRIDLSCPVHTLSISVLVSFAPASVAMQATSSI